MEIQNLLTNPFFWGLALGLLVAGFLLKTSISSKLRYKKEVRKLEAELRELQGHLHTQLKISASGNEALIKQLEDLKVQNENLRVNLSTLQSRPDKCEQRQLRIYEIAISAMREQAPGFAPAWEKALRHAEEEIGKAENGFSKLIRKVIPSYSSSGEKALPQNEPIQRNME